MYKTSKSISILSLAISLVVFFSTVLTLPVLADENYGNIPPDANMMSMSEMESIVLTFDPNDYTFLVYNPGGLQASIVAAMTNILGAAFDPDTDVRTSSNPVTPDDLATYDILIVGSNFGGDTGGLDANTLSAGVTGRVIITGHDADWHSVNGLTQQVRLAAKTFLVNAINYVLTGSGKGMISLGCTATPSPFPYLPKDQWGVSAQTVTSGGEFVRIFTPEALASGVYDDLYPCDLCYNGSYHDKFSISSDSLFVSFELGGGTGDANVTVARDYLAPLSPFSISKTDNATGGRVKPGDRLTYTIKYNYPNGTITLTNVVLTDQLPAEVLHTNVVPDHNGIYDSNTHKVTWTLGILNPGDSNSVTVAVTIGNTRPPSGYLRNTAKITAADTNEATAIRRTWWYKVHNVTKDLWYDMIQSAINNANTDNNDVLVAWPGTYIENVDFDNNKLLTLQSTNPEDPCIIASTMIAGSGGGSDTITFKDNNSTINGFTIAMATGSYQRGVYCYGSSCRPIIRNCVIRNNRYGVYCTSSTAPTIANCVIRNNSGVGVYCAASAPTIANCIIKDHSDSGIYCVSTKQVKIINNWIVNNGLVYSTSYGVFINSTNNEITIRNNTISSNPHGGIYRNDGNDPNISNCIIWNNGNANLSGTFNKINYCDINGGYPSGIGNISYDPCFVAPDINDFNLKFGSLCRNAGDPNLNYDGETDIDGEPRRNGTARVDIGADEFYATTDLNADLTTNFIDYAVFANSWRTYPGNIKWNAACDFVYNNNIDINDLAWFAQDWYFPPADQPSTEPEAPATGLPEEPSMMAEEPQPPSIMEESELPPIYMTCDTNMPEPNQEVTIYFHSDTPLFAMGVCAVITGDANITSAMCEADCNNFGWDNGWNWDPYIDEPNGLVVFGGISWESVATGTVGYFKFIYHGGQVTVSIYDEWSDAFAWDGESCSDVPFSADALIFGSDPNE